MQGIKYDEMPLDEIGEIMKGCADELNRRADVLKENDGRFNPQVEVNINTTGVPL